MSFSGKPRPLKRTLVQYVAISFVLMCAVVLAAHQLSEYLNLRQVVDFEANKLAVAAEKQADQILPGVLLAEEYGSIDLQLKQIQENEGLTSVTFFKAPDSSLDNLLTCPKILNHTFSCAYYFRREIITATEVGFDGTVLGHLVKHRHLARPSGGGQVLLPLALLVGGIAFVFLGLVASILIFIDRHLRKPLLNLKDHLTPILDGESGTNLSSFAVEEMQSIADQVRELVRKYEEKKAIAATGELAAQVAHDIRGPVALLSLLSRDNSDFSVAKKKLIGIAADRINNIAVGLLERYRPQGRKGPLSDTNKSECPTLALAALESIVAEKSALHTKEEVDLRLSVGNASGTFLSIDSADLIRAMANILENSFEAGAKKIEVSLRRSEAGGGPLEILVRDNGRGIAPAVLSQLGKKGVTANKSSGTGLGLYYAKNLAEENGGTFLIESTLGIGTCVSLCLPVAKTPKWYPGRLLVDAGRPIVVIDDDPTTHAQWAMKLGRKLTACYASFSDAEVHVTANAESLLLIDHHFSGDKETGLDFIERHHLSSRSILVTQAFTDPDLQSRCVTLGCQMVPKVLLPYLCVIELPTVSEPPNNRSFDLVLIDDCELMRMVWEQTARSLGYRLRTFASLDEFRAAYVPSEVPIFIDYNLGDVKGFAVAEQLDRWGFSHLYITTGDVRVTESRPYVKAVCEKDFPAELLRSLTRSRPADGRRVQEKAI